MALIAHEGTATFVKLMLYTFEDCHGPIIYTPQAKPTDDLHGMLRAPFSPMTGGTGKHIGIFNDCSVEALLYNRDELISPYNAAMPHFLRQRRLSEYGFLLA